MLPARAASPSYTRLKGSEPGNGCGPRRRASKMQITRRHAARSERTFRDTAKQGPGVGISPNRSGISERSTQPDRKLPDLKASLVLSIGVTMCALSPEPLVANVQYDRLRKRGGADALRHRRTASPPNIAGVKPKPCELAIRAVSYEVAIAASPEPSRSQSRSCLLFRAHANNDITQRHDRRLTVWPIGKGFT